MTGDLEHAAKVSAVMALYRGEPWFVSAGWGDQDRKPCVFLHTTTDAPILPHVIDGVLIVQNLIPAELIPKG